MFIMFLTKRVSQSIQSHSLLSKYTLNLLTQLDLRNFSHLAQNNFKSPQPLPSPVTSAFITFPWPPYALSVFGFAPQLTLFDSGFFPTGGCLSTFLSSFFCSSYLGYSFFFSSSLVGFTSTFFCSFTGLAFCSCFTGLSFFYSSLFFWPSCYTFDLGKTLNFSAYTGGCSSSSSSSGKCFSPFTIFS